MGSSVSSSHNRPSSESLTKFRLSFGSKSHNLVMIPPIPIKAKPFQAQNNGSKEESFFDSQPWLESDCDDDFFSVNGEFTPSRGNTPVHHQFSSGTPRLTKGALDDQTPVISITEPSPKKKKLSELFRDSIREDQDTGNKTISNGIKVVPTAHDMPPKSPYSSTSYVSGTNSVCSSERTANEEYRSVKEKSVRPMQCCLPGFVSGRFSERKKMVPAVTVNDEH